jgi:hypothetical protein
MPNQRSKSKKQLGIYVHEETLSVLKAEAKKQKITLTEYVIRLAEEKSGKKFKR